MVSAVPPVSHILPHCHCFFAENRGLKPGRDQLYTMSMLSVCTVLRDRELVFRGMGMGQRAWGKGHGAQGKGHRAQSKERPHGLFQNIDLYQPARGGWWDGGMWMGGWVDGLIV
jgi:hypothetical protein